MSVKKIMEKDISKKKFLALAGLSVIGVPLMAKDVMADYIFRNETNEYKLSDLVNVDTTPGGSDGDLQINDSGSFGTIAGLNLDKTGNARGINALDIQSSRSSATQVASGNNSAAYGIQNIASGNKSTAVGYNNTASGNSSSASGYKNTASGFYSSALGYSNTASGYYSSAIGAYNTASGFYSSALGFLNTASGNSSSAIGAYNTASGYFSSALGYSNTASGFYSSALGFLNTASGYFSSASGYRNTASGNNSSAIGAYNTASGNGSVTIGSEISALSDNNIKIGSNTKFFNINTTGLSIDNNNALASIHSTGDILATDITSLGSELVTNGSFTGSATGWTLGTGWIYSSNRVLKNTNGTGTLSQAVPVSANKYYLLTFLYSSISGGTLDISLGGSSVETLKTDSFFSRTYSAVIKTTNTNGLIFTPSNTLQISVIDDVSVKEITGGNVLAPLGYIQNKVYTVATLPTVGTAGRRAMVSDANATTFASVVAGGGSNVVPVYDDGTNWRIG